MADLPAEVLAILVCPACHTTLAWDYETSELVCTAADCSLAYPVTDGIPQLRAELARRPGQVR